MRALVQRVRSAEVKVDQRSVSAIKEGLLVLLGVGAEDGEPEAIFLAGKVAALRVFEDEAGKMNRSVKDIDGEVLVVSQFTLLADTSKGNRPGFSGAAGPDKAEILYEKFTDQLEAQGIRTGKGVFGADMQVSLVNDGPVTIMLESR